MTANLPETNRLGKILSCWDAGPLQSFNRPDTGTINQTWIVKTDTGRFVLRQYAHGDPQRIPLEHDLIRWVSERGLPAPCPVETREGETWIEGDGDCFALFAFASGQQTSREGLADWQIDAMGRFLADLHSTLVAYPIELVRKRGFSYDPVRALKEIDRFIEEVRRRGPTDQVDVWALERLEGRKDWILQTRHGSMDAFLSLPLQTTHGDYQESNLFFERGRISAIIDWEQAYGAPAGFEVMRAMHLALRFDPQRCRRFLTAYRERRDLPSTVLDICAGAYASIRGHSLWLFEEIYDAGNERMRRFMNPGPYVPVEQQWAPVRANLVG